MEDILSSIRRVIARDDAPGARAPRTPAGDDVLDLHEENVGTPLVAADDPETPQEELVSAASTDAARRSLEALTAALEPAPAASGAPQGGRTMEDVVLDALRPMLKQWLDTHLPDMVEAMVAKEISRITGKKL